MTAEAYTRSVFHDLYPPAEADEMEGRSVSLMAVSEWLEASGLEAREAALRLGVPEGRLQDIRAGKLSRFGAEELATLRARVGV
jgi:predicted XRE-type DNA-binding protein